jgi:hypothetical protein
MRELSHCSALVTDAKRNSYPRLFKQHFIVFTSPGRVGPIALHRGAVLDLRQGGAKKSRLRIHLSQAKKVAPGLSTTKREWLKN